MEPERDHVLAAIEQGDVLFARANDGSSKIVLVFRTTETSIFARLITSQTKMEFDRKGHSTFVDGDYRCTITSAAPLPVQEYNVVRGLDRKMRLSHWASDIRLTEEETQLLLKMDEFYEARPLPEV
jgi:hypothetical protein